MTGTAWTNNYCLPLGSSEDFIRALEMSNFGKTTIELSSDIRVGRGYQDPRGELLLQKPDMQIIHKHHVLN